MGPWGWRGERGGVLRGRAFRPGRPLRRWSSLRSRGARGPDTLPGQPVWRGGRTCCRPGLRPDGNSGQRPPRSRASWRAGAPVVVVASLRRRLRGRPGLAALHAVPGAVLLLERRGDWDATWCSAPGAGVWPAPSHPLSPRQRGEGQGEGQSRWPPHCSTWNVPCPVPARDGSNPWSGLPARAALHLTWCPAPGPPGAWPLVFPWLLPPLSPRQRGEDQGEGPHQGAPRDVPRGTSPGRWWPAPGATRGRAFRPGRPLRRWSSLRSRGARGPDTLPGQPGWRVGRTRGRPGLRPDGRFGQRPPRSWTSWRVGAPLVLVASLRRRLRGRPGLAALHLVPGTGSSWCLAPGLPVASSSPLPAPAGRGPGCGAVPLAPAQFHVERPLPRASLRREQPVLGPSGPGEPSAAGPRAAPVVLAAPPRPGGPRLAGGRTCCRPGLRPDGSFGQRPPRSWTSWRVGAPLAPGRRCGGGSGVARASRPFTWCLAPGPSVASSSPLRAPAGRGPG